MLATRSCVCGLPGLSTITTRRRRRGCASARLRRRALLPGAEAFSASARSSRHRDVAGDDERRVVGHEVLLPECLHVGARHRLERRLGADLAIAVRMHRAVERRRHDLRRHLMRVVALLHELAETAGALPLDLLGRERRMQRDVSEQIERRGEVLRQRARRDVVASIELLVPSDAPSCATSSAICGAFRVAVPSSSIAAVKLASPGLSSGFASLPVRSTRLAATIGSPRARQDHRQPIGQRRRHRRRPAAADAPAPASASRCATVRRH